MCVIDQAIAFMGGLDLCFGRYNCFLVSLWGVESCADVGFVQMGHRAACPH